VPDKRAQVRRGESEKVSAGDRFAAVCTEELNEPVRRGDVGANCVRRSATVVLQMPRPASGKLARGKSI
jgi:hypothetical protein